MSLQNLNPEIANAALGRMSNLNVKIFNETGEDYYIEPTDDCILAIENKVVILENNPEVGRMLYLLVNKSIGIITEDKLIWSTSGNTTRQMGFNLNRVLIFIYDGTYWRYFSLNTGY